MSVATKEKCKASRLRYKKGAAHFTAKFDKWKHKYVGQV